jgi:plastocyanin
MTTSSTVRRILLGASAFLLALAAAACSTGSSPAPATVAPTTASAAPAASAAGSPATAGSGVTIKGFTFGPTTLTVSPGTTVVWMNEDSTGHTVTAVDGSFDSKTLDSGATFSQAFPTVGTFAYHCTIHSSMTGTIVVK